MNFYLGLKLVKRLALNALIRLLLVRIALGLGIDFSTLPFSSSPRRGVPHALGFSSASLPPLPPRIRFKTFPGMFWAKKKRQHKWWLLPVGTPSQPLRGGGERFLFLELRFWLWEF